jgi:predicted transcriptional regulator
MARNYVSSESFVRGYLYGHKQGWNMQQVADHLGMVKASATVKASQLRQAGIQLPKLAQSRQKMDLGILARMVTDYETSLSDLDGNHNVTISDHLDPEPQNGTEFVTPPDEGNDGRTLVGSM